MLQPGSIPPSCYGAHLGREKQPPSLPLKDITQRATWPTFNRASLFNLPSEAAFLAHLQEQGRWHDVGLHWRNQFLLLGEVYLQKCSGKTFRVLRAGAGSVLAWPLQEACQAAPEYFAEQIKAEPGPCARPTVPAKFPVRDCFFYAPTTPEWISMINWDDFQAVPCSAVSPLGTFAQQLTITPAVGIWLQQTADRRPVLEHAARRGFKGLTDGDLKTLAKELQLDVGGSDSQPNLQNAGLFICIFFRFTASAVQK